MELKFETPTSFKVQATIDFVETYLDKPVTQKVFRILMHRPRNSSKRVHR